MTPSRKTFVIVGFLLGASALPAAKRPPVKPPQDTDKIDVIGHLAFDGKGVTGLLSAEHWRKNYLYLNSDGKITVVDVTDATKPNIEAEHRYSADAGEVKAIVGNTALLVDGQSALKATPRSISIMSFADPQKPQLVREFNGITGFLIDSRRALIYIVNPEGLWILNEKPARDRQLEEEYNRQIQYAH